MRGFPGSSAGKKKIRLQGRTPGFNSWVEKIRWRRDKLPTSAFLGFPCGLAGKESTCDVGDLGSIPGLRRSPGEGIGYPLLHSWLPWWLSWYRTRPWCRRPGLGRPCDVEAQVPGLGHFPPPPSELFAALQ